MPNRHWPCGARGATTRPSCSAALQAALDLPAVPARIECFDISHTGGEGTVASCVVFTSEGAARKEYRRFNIASVAGGDDYGALREAVHTALHAHPGR